MFDPKTLLKIIVGKFSFLVSPIIYDRVKKADAEMYASTGKHIQIIFAYRSTEKQAELYKTMKEKDPKARVSPPGKSFHERGQAIDVFNWKEAEPYLNKYGLVNPMKDDKGHFSYGEFNNIIPEIKKKTGIIAALFIAGFVYYVIKTMKN